MWLIVCITLVFNSGKDYAPSIFEGSFRERQESTENQWERPICEGRGSHPVGLEKGCAVSSNACRVEDQNRNPLCVGFNRALQQGLLNSPNPWALGASSNWSVKGGNQGGQH
ncbi:hypothetical protein SUGI_0912760 [Cryptomeria japonica]|nr:hypothetical protein SUGI_0912760 [Cryptomeria japonica]